MPIRSSSCISANSVRLPPSPGPVGAAGAGRVGGAVEDAYKIEQLYLGELRAPAPLAGHGVGCVLGVELDPDRHPVPHDPRYSAADGDVGVEAGHVALQGLGLDDLYLEAGAQLAEDGGYALPVGARLVGQQDPKLRPTHRLPPPSPGQGPPAPFP